MERELTKFRKDQKEKKKKLEIRANLEAMNVQIAENLIKKIGNGKEKNENHRCK